MASKGSGGRPTIPRSVVGGAQPRSVAPTGETRGRKPAPTAKVVTGPKTGPSGGQVSRRGRGSSVTGHVA
jgi:hypothetical protein